MAAGISRKNTAQPKTQFRGSLVRSVVLWLLVLSLLPVTVTGVVTYLRSQAQTREQVNNQMQVIVDSYGQDLSRFAAESRATLDGLSTLPALVTEIDQAQNDGLSDQERNGFRVRLSLLLYQAQKSANDTTYLELFLLDPQGSVPVSTSYQRENKNYQSSTEIWGARDTGQIYPVYSKPGLFAPSMAWIVTRAIRVETSDARYTLFAVTTSDLPRSVLAQAKKFFPNASATLFTRDNLTLSLTISGNLVGYQNPGQSLSTLAGLIGAQTKSDFLRYQDRNNIAVQGYARWLPELNAGLALEIPETAVFEQLRQLVPFYALVTLFGLFITGLSVYFGSSRLVSPLLGLVEHVRSFSQGDWTHRARVNRQDEIGLLAHSFNVMADEISRLYRSLETKIEERNQQIRTAAEVAQVSTSTTSREEILKRSVMLVTERFHYDYACIYLLDAAGEYFTMQASGGRLAAGEAGRRYDARIVRQSLFGRIIASRQTATFNLRPEEGRDVSETLRDESQAQIVIPVLSGDELLGILDIQSAIAGIFDDDTVSVLEMLARQVAGGIQNIRLLESAQVNLQETALLYQASREITQAETHEEILAVVKRSLEQTPYSALILDAIGDQLQVVGAVEHQNESRAMPSISMALSRIIAALAGRPYLIFDRLNQHAEFYPILSFLMQRGCSQAALFPIAVSGSLARVLVIGAQEHTFTGASLQPYLNLVEVMANAEERFAVLRSLHENLGEMRTVTAVSQAISGENDLPTLFRQLHEQVMQSIGTDLGFYIGLYNQATGMVELPYMVEHGQPVSIPPFPLGEGLTSVLIRRNEPLLLAHNAVEQAAALGARVTGQPSKSWLGVPLSVAGEVIGVMVAEDTELEGRFSEKELHLFSILAPQVAIAIRNAQLLTEMKRALAAYDQERYLLNTLLENMPERVQFVDREGRTIRASRSQASASGASNPAELIGRATGDPADLEVMESGQAQAGLVEKRISADGQERWSLISRLPMRDEQGAVNGLLGIDRDITDLKQAEELAQRRAAQVRTAAEIARDTSGLLNLDELLAKSVNLVRDRFGFYHASIFLIDAVGEYAVLRESTGEAGRQLKTAGHRLAVGSQSLVGQATSKAEHVVVNDVTLDPNYYPNPLLPMTRSELVIPLQVGERVRGALDVQSTEANAFREEEVSILRILADQLAVAIVNAGLFVETQENITKHRFLHQITSAAAGCTNLEDALSTTVESLAMALGTERVGAYLIDRDGSLSLRATYGFEQNDLEHTRILPGIGVIGLAALGGHPILVCDTQTDSRCAPVSPASRQVRSQLAVPIQYSDQVMGVLTVESRRMAAFNENDQEILGSLGNTLGAILSNARLVNQVRQQVEQQKKLFEVTSKIRRSTDIQTIIETSTREICNALQARRAQMEIHIEAQPAVANDSEQTPYNGESIHVRGNGR